MTRVIFTLISSLAELLLRSRWSKDEAMKEFCDKAWPIWETPLPVNPQWDSESFTRPRWALERDELKWVAPKNKTNIVKMRYGCGLGDKRQT